MQQKIPNIEHWPLIVLNINEYKFEIMLRKLSYFGKYVFMTSFF